MKVLRTIVILLLLSSVLTACGGGDDDTPAATSDSDTGGEDTPAPASASGETSLNWTLEGVIEGATNGAVTTIGDQIYVGNDNGILIISAAGEQTGTVENADIQQVSGLAATADGNLAVVDNASGSRGLYIISPDGETLASFSGNDYVRQDSSKVRVEVGTDGNLFIFQTPFDRTKWIHVVSPEGELVDRFSLTLSAVRNPIATIAPDNTIFVTNSRALRVFDETGQSIVLRELQGDAIAGREVVGMDALADNTVVLAISDVGGGNTIFLRIDLQGNLIEEIDGDFVTPAAFALSEDGSLIIVDTGNGNVSSYALAPVE